MSKRQYADEGVITLIQEHNNTWCVHLDNGNNYLTSYKFGQDIHNPAFRGVTVRLLLTEAHRIWDVSVI